MAKKSFTSDQNLAVLRKGKKYPTQNAILRTNAPQQKDLLYKNPEMRKATQQLKEAPRKPRFTGGSISAREPLATSSKRAGSMTQSGLPKTTKGSVKGKPTKAVIAKKRGTPVQLPKKPSQGPVARMTQQAMAKPKAVKKTATPKPKATSKPKITRKPITERQLLDVPNMTPAEKKAYLDRMKRGY